MNMTKKVVLSLALLFGLAAVKAPVASALDYQSSTWTALFVAYVTTNGPTGTPTVGTAGGVASGGIFDVTRIYLSTGYANGAYFVCADSLPLTAQTGGTPSYLTNFGKIPMEQYLFPPVYFVPSTQTVSGLGGTQQVLNFTSPEGGGRTIKNGLSCYVVGDTTNQYWYTIETEATQTRQYLRR